MKNEPLMTYDHMEDENPNRPTMRKVEDREESYPISLYMLLVVDAILISAIVFMTVKIIF
ncbi:MAG: hypothetical protein RL213_1871 [Bacteroidota bacterium]|jgi:hypothetical protein